MMAAGSKAVFYPNLMGTVPMRVLGVEVEATHDFMTASDELRHFVDRGWLASRPGGAALVGSIVPPTPPCTELWGTKRIDNSN